jgi:hypothetical protein
LHAARRSLRPSWLGRPDQVCTRPLPRRAYVTPKACQPGPCSRSFVGGAIQPERACVASHATRQRVSLTPASRRAFRAESSHRYRTAQERRAAAALGVCRSKSEDARAAARRRASEVTFHRPRSGVCLFAHAAQRSCGGVCVCGRGGGGGGDSGMKLWLACCVPCGPTERPSSRRAACSHAEGQSQFASEIPSSDDCQ